MTYALKPVDSRSQAIPLKYSHNPFKLSIPCWQNSCAPRHDQDLADREATSIKCLCFIPFLYDTSLSKNPSTVSNKYLENHLNIEKMTKSHMLYLIRFVCNNVITAIIVTLETIYIKFKLVALSSQYIHFNALNTTTSDQVIILIEFVLITQTQAQVSYTGCTIMLCVHVYCEHPKEYPPYLKTELLEFA